jgi:hypothetical protein
MGTRIGGSLKAAAITRPDRRRPLAAAYPRRDRDGLRGDHERRERRAYRCLRASGVKARLDDRLGVAAVTYLLFGVKLGPGLALSLVLVFAIWIGWRWRAANILRPPGPK